MIPEINQRKSLISQERKRIGSYQRSQELSSNAILSLCTTGLLTNGTEMIPKCHFIQDFLAKTHILICQEIER
jgi:hypothetical protein